MGVYIFVIKLYKWWISLIFMIVSLLSELAQPLSGLLPLEGMVGSPVVVLWPPIVQHLNSDGPSDSPRASQLQICKALLQVLEGPDRSMPLSIFKFGIVWSGLAPTNGLQQIATGP